MNSDSVSRTRDITVLQLLTRLVVETERLIRLADDINQYATTPQAKSALNLIGTEVNRMLSIVKMSIDPLYNLYEIDPGMKASKAQETKTEEQQATEASQEEEYDEMALWSEVIKKEP